MRKITIQRRRGVTHISFVISKNAQVKQLEDRAAAIATLEQSLAALVAEFEGQRRAAAAAHEAELQAASRDVDALRRLAQLQAGQLSKARQVARAALRVRTCVERFLHASIQTVAFMPAGAPVQAGDATEAVEALCTGDMDVAVCVLFVQCTYSQYLLILTLKCLDFTVMHV